MNDMEMLVRQLAADLAPTGLDLQLGVFDLTHRRWVAGSAPREPQGFGTEGYVLALAGGEHLLSRHDDGGIDPIDLVDQVQDWAIDQLGHGWPELMDSDGTFLGILKPGRDSNTHTIWETNDIQVPVGRLSTVTVALPSQRDRAES